ncbi:DUF5709 domain-containing protein [Nocardioides sp. WS12]|uniref:DUF5709 domain-containing protein n=1 Tax=Nocardioides sp. WS12 TaxID=2486272 RepID=UPI0015F92755|nr:DUF5709 domain-containing protein [Nocardioides sp. WS12]
MSDESGQLQPHEPLDDRGVDDVLDEGYSPPERLRGSTAKGVTAREELEGETIEERLRQEEPEADVDLDQMEDDPSLPGEVGDQRAGRLVAPADGAAGDIEQDWVARDVGIDGAGASAEEAAMHITDGPD